MWGEKRQSWSAKLVPLFTQLSRRDVLSGEEIELLSAVFKGERLYAPGQNLVKQGDQPRSSQLLLSGMAASYKMLPTGTRQLTAVHVAGDFVDLHGMLLKTLVHGVVALSDCEVACADHDALLSLTEKAPHLARMLWLTSLIDGSIHREWIVGMGRLAVDAHLAHFICEMYIRLEIIGLTDASHTFSLPVTQSELADILGISVVHINRTLQYLRRQGLITWEGKKVRIDDWTRLVALAGFDPLYLGLATYQR